MKLCVFYHHIIEAAKQQGISVRELLPQISAAGIKTVDVDYDVIIGDRQRICDELRECGIRICSIYRLFQFGKNFTESEILGTISLCREIGAAKLLIIPDFFAEDEKEKLNASGKSFEATAEYFAASRQVAETAELLRFAVAAGKEQGVQIMLEDFDNRLSPCRTKNQLLWWVKNVEGLKVCFDTGNFAFCNESISEAYDLLREHIVHVHCKDRGINESTEQTEFCRGLKPVAFGSGYLPVEGVIRALKKDGFDGYCSIEHYGVSNYLAAIKASAKYLLQFIEP